MGWFARVRSSGVDEGLDAAKAVEGISDHAVFYQGLRHLIDAAMAELPAPA